MAANWAPGPARRVSWTLGNSAIGRDRSEERFAVGAGMGRPGPAADPGATEYYHAARETLVTVKSSISLTDKQHAFAKTLVEAGRYSSLSAVRQQGVDLLRQRTDAEKLETAALRELLSRRRKGEFVDAKGMRRAAGRDGCRQAPRAWSSILSSRSRPKATSG